MAVSKAKRTGKRTTAPKARRTKISMVIAMLKRRQGCTNADILKATGWAAVSLPQMARQGKVKLVKEKQGNVSRYWAK